MANVLIVDDTPETWVPLERLLRGSGHDVACARNGLEALEALDSLAPDVVVTDVRMPVMDGVAFLRAVETSPAHHGRVPVIVMTSEAECTGAAEAARSLGAKAVLEKGSAMPAALLGAIAHYAGD